MTDLYGRLLRYRARDRRAPLEDFLSEALVDLLQRLPPAVAREIVAELLLPHRAREAWFAYAASRSLVWATQRGVDGASRGIVDILLEVDGRPAAVVENKIASGVRAHIADDDAAPMGPAEQLTQLVTYGRWLAGRARHGQSAA